ncbi:MAG TPA: hypothetical protein VI306_09275 [Pyrinomonadaceae bacterium]
MNRCSYLKRKFLAHAASNSSAYIIAEVESSEAGTYALGTNLLTIADCHKQLELEFPLSNDEARQESLTRVEYLAKLINDFRDSLYRQATLIENFTNRSQVR